MSASDFATSNLSFLKLLDVADVDDDAVFAAPGGSLAKSQAGGISCISDRSEIQRAGRLGP